MKRRTHKQILADLLKKNPSASPAFRDGNTDLEDAIVARGGEKGSLRNAGA